MKVLIITGGNIDDDFAFSFLNDKIYDEIIAVDGGLAFADRAEIKVTHLVGDFDTIDKAVLEKYMHREDLCVHQYVPEKDYTDTDIAVNLALELLNASGKKNKEERILHILGGTGTRLDHVMANLQMLKRVMEADVRGAIIDRNNYIEMIHGMRLLKRSEVFGTYTSLIPATMKVAGITLDGFKYPLNQAVTYFGESLCVSNELIADEGMIKIEEGMAWMILSRD